MSFQDIMLKILPELEDGKYKPYVNGGGNLSVLNDFKLPIRSDYDDVRTRTNGTKYIHGGVDIYYYKIENGAPIFLGPTNQPENKHPRVYAPVSGTVLYANEGSVSIMDAHGYIHTIMHMSDIPTDIKTAADNRTSIVEGVEIGKMNNTGLQAPNNHIHVHYEITTHLNVGERSRKINPEAFWNNYPTDTNSGYFTVNPDFLTP